MKFICTNTYRLKIYRTGTDSSNRATKHENNISLAKVMRTGDLSDISNIFLAKKKSSDVSSGRLTTNAIITGGNVVESVGFISPFYLQHIKCFIVFWIVFLVLFLKFLFDSRSELSLFVGYSRITCSPLTIFLTIKLLGRVFLVTNYENRKSFIFTQISKVQESIK